jgi:hypothetical protein
VEDKNPGKGERFRERPRFLKLGTKAARTAWIRVSSAKQVLYNVEEEMRVALIFSLFLVEIGDVPASHRHSPEAEVLVNGVPVPKYYHQGTAYVEAIVGAGRLLAEKSSAGPAG